MAARLALFGKFVRTGRPNTSLPRPSYNRLSTRQLDKFAAARDTLPLSRTLQELPFSATSRVKHLLADDEVAVRDHELAVAESFPLGASDTQDAGALVRRVIEGFVRRVAACDPFGVDTYDGQFLGSRDGGHRTCPTIRNSRCDTKVRHASTLHYGFTVNAQPRIELPQRDIFRLRMVEWLYGDAGEDAVVLGDGGPQYCAARRVGEDSDAIIAPANVRS